MLSWGWRIPFLLALPLGVAGLYPRLRLEKTAAFERMVTSSADQHRTSAKEETRVLFVSHWRTTLLACALIVAWNLTHYLLTSYIPTYITTTLPSRGYYGLSETVSSLAQIVVLRR